MEKKNLRLRSHGSSFLLQLEVFFVSFCLFCLFLSVSPLLLHLVRTVSKIRCRHLEPEPDEGTPALLSSLPNEPLVLTMRGSSAKRH